MNLTWHIVKKDLRRYWPAVALLASIAFTAYALNKWPWAFWLLEDLGFKKKSITGALGVIMAVLSVGLICSIIQEDNPAETRAFWRSRPISPGRLLAAKLLLLSLVFLVAPVAFSAVIHFLPGSSVWEPSFSRGWAGVDLYLFPAMTITALLASATRNVGRSVLTGVISYFCAGMLTVVLVHFAGRPMQVSASLWQSRHIANSAVVGLLGVAGLFNQYFTRRTIWTLTLLFAAAVAVNVITVLWKWDFIG